MATPSIVSISLANRTLFVATYNYSLTSGPALLVGNPIIVTDCTTASLNGNFIIASLLTGPLRFTATTGTSGTITNEAETGTGTVDIEGLNVIPSNLSIALGFGLLSRWKNGSTTDPYGNAFGGANTSGLGQIFPTGLGAL